MRFRINVVYTCSIILMFITFPYLSYADPLDGWHVRNPVLPHVQNNDLSGMAYGNGTFVATGAYGTILTSKDGISWTVKKLSYGSISGVTFGEGIFVGVGEGIFTSPDGSNWKESTVAPPVDFSIRGPVDNPDGLNFPGPKSHSVYGSGLGSVAYGNGTFVAGGIGGTILSSEDGFLWTYRHSNVSQSIDDIAYGNGVFIAIVSSQKAVLSSPDGITWTQQWIPEVGGKRAITYGNNSFVAVGVYDCDISGCYAGIMTSTDGVAWTARDLGIQGDLRGVTFGDNTYVAVGRPGIIVTSHDGINWTHQQPGISSGLWTVTYGKGTFVAGGENGVMLTSSNGANWTVTSLVPGPLYGIAWGNNTYVTVGRSSLDVSSDVFNSFNGVSWDSHSSGFPYGFGDVTYTNEQFIATGAYGALSTSADGIEWHPKASGTTATLGSAAYGNNIYVAVGSMGTVLTSPDGTNWSSTSFGPEIDIKAVIFAENTFLAVGNRYETIADCGFSACPQDSYGLILSSTDGVHWIQKELGHARLTGVVYGNGTYVAVGTSIIFTSTDGSLWTPVNSNTSLQLSAVAYGKGTFVAVGHKCVSMTCPGLIITSADGLVWRRRILDDVKSLSGIAFINDTFVAVGNSGTILQSDPLSGNCTSTLSSDLSIHIPIINFNDRKIWGDGKCEVGVDGSLMCRVTGTGATNPAEFSDCQVSTLSSEYSLHVPALIWNNISFQTDFEYTPSTDGQIWFKLVSAIQN